MSKTVHSILKVLEQSQSDIVGSREISRQLKQHGIELTERTVRYHLKIMDERGLTKVYGKEGRRITDRGREELSQALVSDRIGFIISKIDALSYQSSFDIDNNRGEVVLNISLFPASRFDEAVEIMRPVFASPYIMSDRVVIASEGQALGLNVIPEGMVAIGTVCSVTINSVFLKAGIPVASKYGGLVQVVDGAPSRFVSLISYEGSSLDPLLVFIKSKMTSVREVVQRGTGKVLASLREIPVVSLDRARQLDAKLHALGIGGLLMIGNPNQPALEVPVGMDKAGLVVVGGLNPVAALEEAGLETQSKAMSMMVEYSQLKPFEQAVREFTPDEAAPADDLPEE